MSKELIPMDDMGIFANAKYEMLIDSRKVAEYFGKRHDAIIRDIRNIVGDSSGYSKDFRLHNFVESTYVNEQNHKQPMYIMTRDGFTALAMGFTGKKAAAFKEAYINRFNEMEAHIASLQYLREQYRPLTDAMVTMFGESNSKIFINEANMFNRLVLGMDAKKYRETHGLKKSDPIRPHLPAYKVELMDYLQTIDVGLVYSGLDYHLRKDILTARAVEWKEKHLPPEPENPVLPA